MKFKNLSFSVLSVHISILLITCYVIMNYDFPLETQPINFLPISTNIHQTQKTRKTNELLPKVIPDEKS